MGVGVSKVDRLRYDMDRLRYDMDKEINDMDKEINDLHERIRFLMKTVNRVIYLNAETAEIINHMAEIRVQVNGNRKMKKRKKTCTETATQVI
jgi:archaellum component FlaC